jgi:hypothetical protein
MPLLFGKETHISHVEITVNQQDPILFQDCPVLDEKRRGHLCEAAGKYVEYFLASRKKLDFECDPVTQVVNIIFANHVV